MQINRFFLTPPWLPDDNHRLRIHNRWRRRVTKLNPAIDARSDLAADCDIDGGNVCRLGNHAAKQERCKYCGLKRFHDDPF
jgi:hypothetical protein